MFDIKSELLHICPACQSIMADTLIAVHISTIYYLSISCEPISCAAQAAFISFTKDIFLLSIYVGTYPIPLVES